MLPLTKGHPANKGKIIRQKGCPYWRGTTVSTLLSQKHVQWSLSLLYFITLHFKTILTYDLLILTQPQISYIADLYFKTDRLSYKNAFLSPMDDLKTQVSTLRVAVHWLSTTTFNFSVTDKWALGHKFESILEHFHLLPCICCCPHSYCNMHTHMAELTLGFC